MDNKEQKKPTIIRKWIMKVRYWIYLIRQNRVMSRQKRMLIRAKKQANYLHSTTGQGYYVIWTGKKYMIATSKHIEDGLKSMCKHGVEVQTAKTKLINAAVYRAM
jgi:hypothetical protein